MTGPWTTSCRSTKIRSWAYEWDGRKVIENRRAYGRLFEVHGADALPLIEEQAPMVARAIRENVLSGR